MQGKACESSHMDIPGLVFQKCLPIELHFQNRMKPKIYVMELKSSHYNSDIPIHKNIALIFFFK